MRSFPHILTLIFVVAKLTGYFPYSWYVVFLPTIVAVGLALAIFALVGIITVALAFIAAKKK